MVFVSKNVNVSVAYEYDPVTKRGLGGNWELWATAKVPPGVRVDFSTHLAALKDMVDHRCLSEGFEQSSRSLADALFARALNEGSWHSLKVFENDKRAVEYFPGTSTFGSSLAVLNLQLSFGGKSDRENVTQKVMKLFSCQNSVSEKPLNEWAGELLKSLKTDLSSLQSLRVDLGQGKYIVVGQERF